MTGFKWINLELVDSRGKIFWVPIAGELTQVSSHIAHSSNLLSEYSVPEYWAQIINGHPKAVLEKSKVLRLLVPVSIMPNNGLRRS